MNKTEFADEFRRNHEKTLSKKDCIEMVDVFIESLTSVVRSGEKVSLQGFGTFEVRDRAERKGINPQTQEEVLIPARKVLHFKPSKTLSF